MTIDDAALLAWLDGELSADEAARVAAAVAADPRLSALADAHRAVAEQLLAEFDPILAETVPARLQVVTEVTLPPAAVTDLAAVRAARAAQTSPPRRWLPQLAALAASLAIGLLVGRAGLESGAPGLVVPGAGGLQAAGPLAIALDTQLAATPDAGAVQVAISFRDSQGRVCRSWQAERQEGIACRAGDGWAVTAALARAPQADGRYRMASGPGVAALVDAMIAGEPFDAAQEQAGRASGWR